jgi:hypothetical protein
MMDVSDTGAKLSIDGSVEGLAMKEFFLVLSTMGKAYRRCELAWVNGAQGWRPFHQARREEEKILSAHPALGRADGHCPPRALAGSRRRGHWEPSRPA